MKKARDIIKGGHDAAYRALLSHPKIVEDLITFFVRGDFVKEVDFTSLAPYRENFIARGRMRRAVDVIWSVNIRGRGTAYFFILLEPQSTIYRWMSVRVLVYILLLYQDLIIKKKVKGHDKLPPVLPIVIYRGSGKWKAPLNTEDLIETPFDEFTPFVPKFSFLKVEAGQPKKVLFGLRSIMAKVFLFETAQMEELGRVFNSLRSVYSKLTDTELKGIVKQWYQNRMESMDMAGVDLDESEAEKMFEAKVKRYQAKLRAEGKVEGKVEGRAEGRAEAERLRLEEKREIARRLLSEGMDEDKVRTITALTVNDMKAL